MKVVIFLIIYLSSCMSFSEEMSKKVLSFDQVLSHALQKSQSYKSIEIQDKESGIPVYQVRDLLSPNLKMKIGAHDDRREQVTSLRPKRSQGIVSEVELSKYFRTGTAVSVGMQINKRQNTFSDDPVINSANVIRDPYYESIGTVSLKQKLWQDSFGYSVRKSLKAAKKMKESRKLSVKDEKEKWLLDLAKLYDAMILSQLQYESSLDDLTRKKRLFRIINKQKRRGAAEASDVIEAEAAVMYSEQDVEDKKYSWRRNWLSFRNYVGLPKSWRGMSPDTLELKVSSPVVKSKQLCQHKDGGTKSNHVQQLISLQKEASELSIDATKNLMKPDLSFEAKIGNNGLDLAGRNYANKEVFESDNPMWYMGLSLNWNIGSYKEKSKLLEHQSKATQARALHNQNKVKLKESWSIHCDEILTLMSKVKSFESMKTKLLRRLNIQEKKFRNGYIPAFKVIRAGDDYSKSILALQLSQAELRRVAWRVQYLAGHVVKHLNRVQSLGLSSKANLYE